MKSRILPQLFVLYVRYFIGGAFVFASLIKIKGRRFTTASGESNPIDTAWHFFETLYQSGLYWQFIGLSQLLAGMLLMTQRYSKLGAIVNLPILLNVFVITLSYDFAYTPVVTGSMLLANLALILWDWNTFKILINQESQLSDEARMEKDPLWVIIGVLLFLFTFIYRLLIDQYDIFLWWLVFCAIGLLGLFLGLLRERKRRTSTL